MKTWHEKNKDKVKTYKKAWYNANKNKIKARSKQYYDANKNKVNARTGAWKKANKDKTSSYQIKKLKTDPKYKLNKNISRAIRRSLKNGKNNNSWRDLVPYSLNMLKKHLEKQFQDGMAWNNYGEWHIDHKTPISAFNFTKPEHNDFKKCWALKNLQPLWAEDNILKSDKLMKHFQPSLLM